MGDWSWPVGPSKGQNESLGQACSRITNKCTSLDTESTDWIEISDGRSLDTTDRVCTILLKSDILPMVTAFSERSTTGAEWVPLTTAIKAMYLPNVMREKTFDRRVAQYLSDHHPESWKIATESSKEVQELKIIEARALITAAAKEKKWLKTVKGMTC